MEEYISLEKVHIVIDFIYALCMNKDDHDGEMACTAIKTGVKTLAVDDVRKNIRADWTRRINTSFSADFTFDEWFCSACGCVCQDADEKPTYNFCPQCGADMRKQT